MNLLGRADETTQSQKASPKFLSPARVFLTIAGILTICGLVAQPARAQYVPPASNRVDLNFNLDWKFIKQDVTGASATAFNDSSWSAVSLPHTWNNDKFREWISTINDTPADPLVPHGTYYGKAWYRKHFTIDTAYTGRKVILEFQGIGRVATFYVNGQYAGLHENGVAPCGIDITSFVNYGADNVIAVQVNNDENYKTINYAGAKLPYGQPFNPNFGGLNRDVTLHICDQLHQTFPLYRNLGTVGTYIFATNIDTLNKTAGLTMQTQVENDYPAARNVDVSAVVVDNAGNVVLTASASGQPFTAGQTATVTMTGNMTGIHFWSPDYPYLYKVYTILSVGGNVVDVCQTPLGVRKFTFGASFGLEVNGHPLYLKGYAPRCSMEWPAVGVPVDWLNDFDFKLMKDSNANFVRPMHIAPRKAMVEAADKFGVVMVCPSANNEGDDTDPNIWQERLDIMRDVTIYFRNNPSVLFYEGCNQILTAQHMTDMKNVRLTWDPSGGRLAGLRSNDTTTTLGIREYGCDMDNTGSSTSTPTWDAEYARGESPRRVWDEATPMLNPRWDGVDPSSIPYSGITYPNTTSRYLLNGYFYIASDYHQQLGLNSGNGDFIGDYLVNGYFRLQSSEDMVVENLAKYYARYARSAFIQSASDDTSKGVMVGGGKIIWADSVTDGRMRDTETTRVSGAVDGARLPKEVFYGLQVAHNPNPQVYVVGHWNYPAGTIKRVFVCSNTASVKMQTYDSLGKLITDYGTGKLTVIPSSTDSTNHYVFEFDNVAWQPGTIKVQGYDSTGKQVATHQKTTAGAPASLRLTPILGPSGVWMADGSDIAMFDVEVLDAAGNRCPTYEDRVEFTCSGNGVFLGGYNSGIRYSTNYTNLTSGYHLNVECGINRVFVRATRSAGNFTLNVSRANGDLTSASKTITSTSADNTNGVSSLWPQKYSVPLGPEPTPVQEGVAPPPPPPPAPTAPATSVVDFAYSGGHPNATLVSNVQPTQQVYMDAAGTFGSLPAYLVGGEFIRPYQADADEDSSTDQYQFNLSRFSYVYLLVDAANDMPANENNERYQWKLQPDQVTVNSRAMNLFKSRLMAPYENCYFAANGYGATKFAPNSNMYLVFVEWAETQVQSPSQKISASASQGGHAATGAIDGDVTTRWSASDGTYPQTLTLDLGQQCLIGGYLINWYNNATRAYKYKIDLSNDGITYTLSLDQTGNTTTGYNEYRVPATGTNAGRYLRITVTGGSGYASIYELIVNGLTGVPDGVTAAPSDKQVALSWNPVPGATTYYVKRAGASGGPYVTIGSSDSPSYADTAVVDGTSYYYVVSSLISGGESNNSAEIAALPLSPIQTWRQNNFGTINPNDPIAGDTATPLHDGIPNLLKYALGLDPKKLVAGGLPSSSLLGGYLTLAFDRQKAATDITYHVKVSSDLSVWSEIWNSAIIPYGGGTAAFEAVTVSDTVPTSSVTGSGRFLRLEVTRP